jgi:hypothetical protein
VISPSTTEEADVRRGSGSSVVVSETPGIGMSSSHRFCGAA